MPVELALHLPKTTMDLPIKWCWTSLSEVCEGIFDCPHSTPIINPVGPFLARSQDIRTGVFDKNQAVHVSDKTYLERIQRAEPRHGDLLFSREGTYFGIAAEVPPESYICLGQRMVLLRPKPERLNSRYAKYWLNSPIMIQFIKGFRDGTVAERLNMPTIRSLPVLLPTLSEQTRIAHILGTLDDKIELNRRMNETLEAMARALFKSWFVDFDPVRAKAAGCKPEGMDADTAALFPSSFVDSELGKIPKGWRVGQFSDLVSRRSERIENRKAFVLSAIATGNLIRSDDHFNKRVYSKDISKYLIVEQWDFAYNPARINIGSIGIHEEPFLGAVSPVYVVFRPKAAFKWFIKFCLENDQTKIWINTLASGSVRQSLSFDDFGSMPCIIPSEHLGFEFNCIREQLRSALLSHLHESQVLIALRDSLLPKLLSGEIPTNVVSGQVGAKK